jgi:HSP20 family protein
LLRRLRELKDEDSPLTAKVGSVSGPSVEIDDRPAEILVRLAIPGATKKGLSISVADRTLTISGTLSERQRTDDGYHVHEELLGESFTKSTLLPADVDAAKAEAHLKDGVLEVLLPKRRPAKIHKVRLS